jgi:hypothetical protein
MSGYTRELLRLPGAPAAAEATAALAAVEVALAPPLVVVVIMDVDIASRLVARESDKKNSNRSSNRFILPWSFIEACRRRDEEGAETHRPRSLRSSTAAAIVVVIVKKKANRRACA